MTKGKYTKQEFINAYKYAYGSTIKQAIEVWKNASEEYINAIVDGYKMDCRKAFYED